MRYTELIERSIYNRGLIVELDGFKPKPFPEERYTSLFNFTEDIIDFVDSAEKTTGKRSVEYYVGECNMNYLWIDVDSKIKEDAGTARDRILDTMGAATSIILNLDIKYGLKYNSIPIYFSGNKGFHIGINSEIFGADNYWSENLPAISKVFVREITDNNKMVDFVIYNTTRIFRVPLSRHAKSGLYKVLVPFKMIESGDVDGILERAAACYSKLDYKFVFEKNQALTDLFRKSVSIAIKSINLFMEASSKGKMTDHNGDVTVGTSENKTLFHLPSKGGRNSSLQRMSVRLFDSSLKTNEVIDIMRLLSSFTNSSTSASANDQITEKEIHLMLNAAYKFTRGKRSENVQASDFSKDLSVLINSAMNTQYIPTYIPDVDHDLGGGMAQGNVYNFIGKGGSMKSIITMYIACRNILDGRPGIFFNCEMSYPEFLNRLCMMLLGVNINDEIKEGRMNKDQAIEAFSLVKKKVEKLLFVENSTSISVIDMNNKITDIETSYGIDLKFAFLDSFSTLDWGGKRETDAGISNSLELKELAKSKNIVVGIINHTNAMADRALKDNSQFVRGGPKIIDNGDAYFCLSSIVDEGLSVRNTFPPDLKYVQSVGHIRFVNKRGSGRTTDAMFMLNGDNLHPLIFTEEQRINFLQSNIPNR